MTTTTKPYLATSQLFEAQAEVMFTATTAIELVETDEALTDSELGVAFDTVAMATSFGEKTVSGKMLALDFAFLADHR